MKRRILLSLFILLASAATISVAIWYSGYLEEWNCANSGGTWVAVRKTCFDPNR